MTETVEKIRERKGFYSHYYRVAVTALRVSMIIIVLLIFGIILWRATYEESQTYATSSNGILLPLKTYTQPPLPQK
jgi:hypothetical protein